jgi:probable rRNA maturation factor
MASDGHRRRPALQVRVADGAGRGVSAPGIARWLTRVAPARARGVVSVALVSDARVRALNKRYRRRDYATDVLSFPADAAPHVPPGLLQATVRTRTRSLPPSTRPYLGDIVIARGVARRQARAAGHSELTELRVLALHGLLHLMGYDHDGDAGTMARVERSLRARGGLREGLIERSVRP